MVAGRLITYLVMGLPAAKSMTVPFFKDLFACDMCLGVWVYFPIVTFFHVYLGPYVPLVSEAITAAIFSYITHIFFLGLKLKYGNFDVS